MQMEFCKEYASTALNIVLGFFKAFQTSVFPGLRQDENLLRILPDNSF